MLDPNGCIGSPNIESGATGGGPSATRRPEIDVSRGCGSIGDDGCDAIGDASGGTSAADGGSRFGSSIDSAVAASGDATRPDARCGGVPLGLEPGGCGGRRPRSL